jgi:hypothetical protein
MIRQLPVETRDQAYRNICRFILTRVLPLDPFDETEGEYEPNYDSILELIKILEEIERDSYVYSLVSTIVKSVKSDRNKLRFTQQQKIEIGRRLEIIVNKLPNPNKRFITHDGYKLASLAKIFLLRQAQPSEWVALVEKAMQIDNMADRALVLGIIATAMPANQDTRRKDTIQRAKQTIQQISSPLDQGDRLGELAEMLAEIDQPLARNCLRLAMEVTVASKRPELYPIQQKAIDLAYQLDQDGDFANRLAVMADDDPARAMARTRLNHRLDLLKLKRQIINEKRTATDTKHNADDYAQATWMLLGSLNANRIGSLHINETLELGQIASNLPLGRSYPIYAWFIENAVKRHANTPDAANSIRPLFQAAITNAHLVEQITLSATCRKRQLKRNFTVSTEIDSSVIEIKPGERDRAIAIIRDWFEREVKEHLIIVDEYFGPSDLEILLLLRSVNPRCRVEVLTSRKHNQDVASPWEDTYRNYWRLHISGDQDPPDSEIVIVGTKSTGKSPIHDRRWLTTGGGLRIGTSFNSLGMTQRAEISRYSPEEATAMENTANQYLHQRKREDDLGEKLIYTIFTL